MPANRSISVTLFNDPTCPWGYSASPALRVLEWRYKEQLDWRLVLVGLSESPDHYESRGLTPLWQANGVLRFRERYGMPFAPLPKARLAPSSRACRAVIAVRRQFPGREWFVLRWLQLAQFNTPLLFDDDRQMREVLTAVPQIDAEEVVAAIDSPEVLEAYEEDKSLTRTAAGSPTQAQGKAGESDTVVRYTAPSLIFETQHGQRLEAGGFQPVEAYDVILANLEPLLERYAPPADPDPLLRYFDFGLTTQEVAACLVSGNDRPDRVAAEAALLELVADGRAERHPLGGDALWTLRGGPRPPDFAKVGAASQEQSSGRILAV
jgi:2-hydroxychromene-2-carboxylate isomerase